MTPSEVVEAYFERMRAGDPNVADLFGESAQLVGLGNRVVGREAIRAFYTEAIERGGPQPSLAGPLMCDGGRVAAEIWIDLADGSKVHVVDLFHVEDGQIAQLGYFVADEPPAD